MGPPWANALTELHLAPLGPLEPVPRCKPSTHQPTIPVCNQAGEIITGQCMYRIVPYRIIPYRIVLYRTISYLIVSYRIVSSRFSRGQCVIRQVRSSLASAVYVPYHIVPYRIVSSRFSRGQCGRGTRSCWRSRSWSTRSRRPPRSRTRTTPCSMRCTASGRRSTHRTSHTQTHRQADTQPDSYIASV